MNTNETFVYVIYIAATPEQVWEALTVGKFTEEYWGGRRIQSDWEIGSEVRLLKSDNASDGVRGEVLEFDPPRKLVMLWRSQMQPDAPLTAATQVTMKIDSAGPENVKLTLLHEPHEAGSMVVEGVRNGWPAILSSLKSFLETGKALDATKRWAQQEAAYKA